jgi:hypothetical protein
LGLKILAISYSLPRCSVSMGAFPPKELPSNKIFLFLLCLPSQSSFPVWWLFYSCRYFLLVWGNQNICIYYQKCNIFMTSKELEHLVSWTEFCVTPGQCLVRPIKLGLFWETKLHGIPSHIRWRFWLKWDLVTQDFSWWNQLTMKRPY